ncbi:pectinesterase inhibitor 10 [Capsella rubella]|uniref:pectinesterase inhibitor 10 n=1 Tax=Capsella rubella TaxID=81985 RepID=UPI000CD54C9B|nr:pectinesterase inhibitor 10 [Capsella rubella]
MKLLPQIHMLLLSIAILLFITPSSSSSSSLSPSPSSSSPLLSPSLLPSPSKPLSPSPPPSSLSPSPSKPLSPTSLPPSSPPPSSLSPSSPPPSYTSPTSPLPSSIPPPSSLPPSYSSPTSPPPPSSSLSTHQNQTNLDYIKTSCNLTIYKTLCYTSLSPYASKIISNPQKLSVTALNLTLSSAKSASTFIKNISHGGGLTGLEAVAVADCVEEIGNSVISLQDSMRELDSVNHTDIAKFQMVMSDVETWVSAALTNDETCMDGFSRIKSVVKDLVRQHVVQVARLTSNALALINMYASTQENLSYS